jgi:hypothetical protein
MNNLHITEKKTPISEIDVLRQQREELEQLLRRSYAYAPKDLKSEIKALLDQLHAPSLTQALCLFFAGAVFTGLAIMAVC